MPGMYKVAHLGISSYQICSYINYKNSGQESTLTFPAHGYKTRLTSTSQTCEYEKKKKIAKIQILEFHEKWKGQDTFSNLRWICQVKVTWKPLDLQTDDKWSETNTIPLSIWLANCGQVHVVAPFGEIDLGQHWLG